MTNVKESANFIWSIADLLRGDYRQSDYGKEDYYLLQF
jgi:type I restriction enzyme M protein